jgi:hypothetical protein
VPDFEVRGSRDLALLGRRLKDVGRGDLRRELLRGIRTAGREALPDVRQSAYRTLPRRGGLAERVGKQAYSVQTRLSLGNASVRLVGRGMKELRDIDSGRLRHPVWGDRSRWVQQEVTPGFWSKPLQRRRPKMQAQIEQVMYGIARKVTRRF